MLAARLRRDSRDLVVRLLDESGIEQIPFGDAHWKEAVDAYLRFGKGRHKAQLNFGDCLTYAVARLADEPLLFTGNDFTETDLDLVLSSSVSRHDYGRKDQLVPADRSRLVA